MSAESNKISSGFIKQGKDMSLRSLRSKFLPSPFSPPKSPILPHHFRSGYKEQQYLVVVDSTHQSCHRDEKKEDSHSNDSSDDVDAGHQTQALTPSGHSNEQQTYQLRETESRTHLRAPARSTAKGLTAPGTKGRRCYGDLGHHWALPSEVRLAGVGVGGGRGSNL